MTTQHTPGPWRLDYKRHNVDVDNEHAIIDGKGTYLGLFRATVADEDCGKANARLIAAAPAMLAALEAIIARIDGEYDNPALVAFGPLSIDTETDCKDIAVAAIAKARGEG